MYHLLTPPMYVMVKHMSLNDTIATMEYLKAQVVRLWESPDLIEDIFENKIVPNFIVNGVQPSDPCHVIVLGQQGSGKTRAIESIRKRFEGEMTCLFSVDNLYSHVPGYEAAALKNVEHAQAYAHGIASLLAEMLEERAISQRANFIEETAETARIPVSSQKMRYRHYPPTELQVIVTKPDISYLSVLSRYAEAAKSGELGGASIVSKQTHDDVCRSIPEALSATKKNRHIGSVTLTDRDSTVLYSKRRNPFASDPFPQVREIYSERMTTPLSEKELKAYTRSVNDLSKDRSMENFPYKYAFKEYGEYLNNFADHSQIYRGNLEPLPTEGVSKLEFMRRVQQEWDRNPDPQVSKYEPRSSESGKQLDNQPQPAKPPHVNLILHDGSAARRALLTNADNRRSSRSL